MDDVEFSGEKFFRSLIDAVPFCVFVVDKGLSIYDANESARKLQVDSPGAVIKKLCGEVLSCVHHMQHDGGCGNTGFCPDCTLRKAAAEAVEKQIAVRKTAEMIIQREGESESVWFQLTAAPLSYEGKEYSVVTFEEVTELVLLRSILPICMHCRKIRDDDNQWHKVEDYLRLNSSTKFSHGICPACLDTHYPKYSNKMKRTSE